MQPISHRVGHVVLFLLFLGHVRTQEPPTQALLAYLGQKTITNDSNDNYGLINADPSNYADLPPCETTTFPIYTEDLVGMPEDDCNNNEGYKLPYARGQPFGIRWQDDTPLNCSIATLTIAIQAGFSCTGSYGQTNLNSYITPSRYRFPYENEYNETCYCQVPYSPLQVFNFYPQSAYNQGGENTFTILNSNGTNGLRSFVPNATTDLFGLVITNQWAPSSNMNINRTQFAFASTPRGSGTVLAVGGVTFDSQVTNTADEYFPVTGTWSPTGNMSQARQLNQVALLNEQRNPLSSDSYFLITSGGLGEGGNVLSSAEVYNTTSRTWSSAPAMKSARARHTLTSAFNGTRSAVAVGGFEGGVVGESSPLATIEIYSWDSNSWSYAPQRMTNARYRHQAVVLQDWTVLIMGGQGADGTGLSSVESLSLSTGNVSTKASMNYARYAFTSTVLQNGSVLVIGGAQLANSDSTWENSQLLASCELYVNGTWYRTGSLTFPRAGHQAVLTEEGSVLVIGGGGDRARQASELWSNVTGQWVTVAPLPVPKINFGVARLPYGRIVAFGGSLNSTVTTTTGTSSSYIYTTPFSLSDESTFVDTSDASAPAPTTRDSYRAPPITLAPPAPPTRNIPANILFALGPLPANTSALVVVESPLSGGAIGGIVGGAVGGLLLITAVVFFLLHRRRKRRRAKRYSPEGLEKIQSRYGTASNGSTIRNTSGTLVYKEDGTPVFLVDSLQGSQARMDSFRSGSSSQGAQNLSGPSNNSASGQPRPAFTSPFGSTMTVDPSTVPLGSGPSHGSSVMMPRGIPSPFGLDSGVAVTTRKSSGALRSLKSIDETTTQDSVAPDTHSSFVPLSQKAGERSTSSDLSRVSVAIRHELHAADWKIERSAIVLDKRLGKGGFGEVFRGQHHGSPVAVKVLLINDERTMLDACQEFGHLHNLRHSKLVVSYGACIDDTSMMLVMELMEEDLFHAIANDATGSGDSVLWNFRGWQIAVDVASALVFLHSKGLVHLDVKSLNILLKGRRTEAKLGDLGLAKLIPDGHLALQHTLAATPAYSAPEVMQAQLSWRLRTQGRRDLFHTEVGTPADIFAFGVVLFELCTGQHPARWRQDFEGTFRPDQAPPDISKLVDDCLNDEPSQRPTARQLLDILLKNKPRHLR